tara:strand:+ start:171 stop:674 length:504 start_codon:yes stop_codon:yes gene_type:complete
MKLLIENWRKFLTEEKEFKQVDDYYEIGVSKSEYHPAWDYEPNENPSLLSQEAYELAFDAAQELSSKLGLGQIALYYVQGESFDNHVARYINGTYKSPVIVLSDKVEEQEEAKTTLFHELGHAYVESIGLETDEETEEDLVEEFARLYTQDPNSGLNYLVNFEGAET